MPLGYLVFSALYLDSMIAQTSGESATGWARYSPPERNMSRPVLSLAWVLAKLTQSRVSATQTVGGGLNSPRLHLLSAVTPSIGVTSTVTRAPSTRWSWAL